MMRKLQPVLNPRIGDLVFDPSVGNGVIIEVKRDNRYLVADFDGTHRYYNINGGRDNIHTQIIALFQGHVKFPYDLSVDEIEQVTRKG